MKEDTVKNLDKKATNKNRPLLEHWQMISVWLVIYDVISIAASYFLALWIRFDCQFSKIPDQYMKGYLGFIAIAVVFSVIVLWKLNLYHSLWRFASDRELINCATATLVSFVFHSVGITVLSGAMPMSYYVFGVVIQFCATVGIRFSYRLVNMERRHIEKATREKMASKILLVGAGDAGRIILREIQKSSQVEGVVKCVIDDNPNKWGRYLDNVPIEGGRESILACVEKYQIDKIYVAIPSAKPEQIRDILNICKETGCELKNLPSVYHMYSDGLSVSICGMCPWRICWEDRLSGWI